MKKNLFEKLEEINQKIFNCKKCDFHLELENFYYRPDAPILEYTPDQLPDYKVMSIGINPAWDDEKYTRAEWQSIYKETEYPNFKKRLLQKASLTSGTQRDPYRVGLTKTFNAVNELLNIYPDRNIQPEHIYKYLFWANLSFCNSQSPLLRIFNNKKVSCRVYSEEIPNCLEQGYLKDLVAEINPRLILFFTISATSYLYYKLFLRQIFSIEYDGINSQAFDTPAYDRNNKAITTTIIAANIKNTGTQILFMPHPSFRFNDEYREAAIRKACDWLLSSK